MGNKSRYRRKPKTYKLTFAEGDLAGLEVLARSLPLGEFLALQELQATAETDPKVAADLLKQFASVITEWNLDDEDGNPVPPVFAQCRGSGLPVEPGQVCKQHTPVPQILTGPDGDSESKIVAAAPAEPCEYTGLCSEDFGFVLTIFQAWMEAVASIPKTLNSDSNGTGTFQGPPIPMEISSPSRGN